MFNSSLWKWYFLDPTLLFQRVGASKKILWFELMFASNCLKINWISLLQIHVYCLSVPIRYPKTQNALILILNRKMLIPMKKWEENKQKNNFWFLILTFTLPQAQREFRLLRVLCMAKIRSRTSSDQKHLVTFVWL